MGGAMAEGGCWKYLNLLAWWCYLHSSRDAQTPTPQKAPVALPMKTLMIIRGLLDVAQNSLCSHCTAILDDIFFSLQKKYYARKYKQNHRTMKCG